jgi:predicted MPP superfamily phosphohydrolase
MATLRILHLSDAHLGRPELATDWQTVMEPLLDDVRHLREDRGLQADIVVFSGDLAFGAAPRCPPLGQQYEQVNELLHALAEASGVGRPLPLFAVPGNHDVDRSKLFPHDTTNLEQLQATPAKVDGHARANDPYWQHLVKRQEAFRAFLERLPSNSGRFVDDSLLAQAATIEKDGAAFRLIGINTSWASSARSEKGRLWITRAQAAAARTAALTDTVNVLVAHHPASWLHSVDEQQLEKLAADRFRLHLRGHEHILNVTPVRNHVEIAAGAVYAGSERPAGYSLIELEHHGSLRIHCRWRVEDQSSAFRPWQGDGTDERGVFADDGRARNRRRSPRRAQPRRRRSARRSKARSGAAQSAQAPRYPIEPIDALLTKTLARDFEFFYEDGSKSLSNGYHVYWPVRLRRPTPIHAVQSFVAAALQRNGATIELWIDDLGSTDYRADPFRARLIDDWFTSVGGEAGKVTVRRFSQVFAEHASDPWRLMRSWWGDGPDLMGNVLTVTKLLPTDGAVTIDQLKQRRPRRLMTPALVWAGLEQVLAASDTSAMTLGGQDERALWSTWASLSDKARRVHHLYVPQLTSAQSGDATLHMSDQDVGWNSEQDVRDFIDRQLNGDGDATPAAVRWCYMQCVQLPRVIAGSHPLSVAGEDASHDLQKMPAGDRAQFVGKLAHAIAANLFRPKSS